jgi:PAS domain S-box-containing protein
MWDVSTTPSYDGSGSIQPPAVSERIWLAWGRSVLALLLVGGLLSLGVSNLVSRARYAAIEDGVLWSALPDGITAVEVPQTSAGAAAGIAKGDILLAINGKPVATSAELRTAQRQLPDGATVTYSVARIGERRILAVTLTNTAPPRSLYFVLAAVGLFTLLVGASVRIRRPRDQATLHFFWLCVACFGMFGFSFNGSLDRLDWVFYWGDAIATVVMPPLLLHFAMAFPHRPSARNLRGTVILPLIYAPGIAIAVGRIVTMARGTANGNGPLFSQLIALLDRVEIVYLAVCVLSAVVVLVRAFDEIESVTGQRQLRWMAWGTVLGVGPFALGYALPWALGAEPGLGLQLTAIPLGLVPLAFASAIVRYRLRDVEVIVKRGIGYATFLGATAAILYFVLRRTVGLTFGNEDDPHNWIVALLATIIVVLIAQPVKAAVQDAMDRVFYRDRYDYRRALVAFARDLNRDLDVVRLSQRLVSRIVETLALDRMALMLADERLGDFHAIDEYGFVGHVPPLSRRSSFVARLDAGHIVVLDGSDPMSVARFAAEDVDFWRDQGISYLVPCVFEGATIAVMALGREETDEPLNSEDLDLLTAVAGQVATALENGRLYRQLHVKAQELGRMREFNENILESLDDGLVVFDEVQRIVRWNHALEHIYGVPRSEAVGRLLSDVFDAPFLEALRAALREHPEGTSLFKVPLSTRRVVDGSDSPRLLVNATAVPLRSATNPEIITGTILLIEDLTDRVRLEEQLQISEKMASIGLLAAGVAHEVNTPLTGISSFTQMLLEGADPADPKTVLLEKIERQTFRAAKIVNGLLTLSRPGPASPEQTRVDLNDVVSDVFSLLEHQFTAARIRVRRELAPNASIVLGIEHQLQQVFLNLFLNARDAMPRGGWLTVTTRTDGRMCVAEIADTGSGIPPEHLARIYDPFFTTKAIGRGTGLGLSISYGIVREHGGDIRCDSSVGQGTRFTVTLPAAQPVVRTAAQ